MSWIEDIISPQTRQWEEFYRNRFQHDSIVRSTHGVNCTGGCSWQIHVKDGIVVWETQQLDYPLLESSLPPYEPQRVSKGNFLQLVFIQPIAHQVSFNPQCFDPGNSVKKKRKPEMQLRLGPTCRRMKRSGRLINRPGVKVALPGFIGTR